MALQLEAQSPVSYSHVTLPLCKVTGVGGPFLGAGLNLHHIKQLHVSAHQILVLMEYSKNSVERTLSQRPKNVFQDQLSLNVGQKYSRMLHGEHSAILLTFIKLPFIFKIFFFYF